MQMSFSVEMPGMDIKKSKIEMKAKLVLWHSMHKMEELAKMRVPVNSGMLKRSIRLSRRSFGARSYTLRCGSKYGVHVEFGTSPHYVPIQPLKDWSKRVLGDESAAYAVRAKIAKEGTPMQPFFRPAIMEVKHIWVPRYWRDVFGAR